VRTEAGALADAGLDDVSIPPRAALTLPERGGTFSMRQLLRIPR
jgi:hypothetical protein